MPSASLLETAFVNATARSSPDSTDELHGLVHGRVSRNSLHVAELVRAKPQRCPDRRIEPGDAPPSECLDRVVERADTLHGTEGKALRERAIPVVETRRRRAKGAVGVRVVLEDPPQDLERGRPRRAYARSPRSHAS